jgi:hypothetical protein
LFFFNIFGVFVMFTTPTLPASLDFTPVREPVTRNGNVVPNMFWVINPLNDAIIGDGKSRHSVTNYTTMWESLWDGLKQSTLDLSNAVVKADSIGNGAAMRAEIVLPNHNFEKRLGEAAQMKIVISDSHDQTVRRQVKAMIMRLACLNGMISAKENIGFAQKHTTMNDPELIGTIASGWLPKLEADADLMRDMVSIKIDKDTAVEFYRDHVAKYKTNTGLVKINEKMLERIVAIHNSYNMGNNAYRVYNTLTHMSTHVDKARGESDDGRKRLRIEQDIEAVIRGPFAELLAR